MKKLNKGILLLMTLSIMICWHLETNALNASFNWYKEFPDKICFIDFAKVSGDTFLLSGGTFFIFDKEGSIALQKEISPDKRVVHGKISSDGNFFVYHSVYDLWYSIEYEEARRGGMIHYCKRNGTELWNKPLDREPYLSDNGDLILATHCLDCEDFNTYLIESTTGNILWQKETKEFINDLHVVFSSNGEYIGLSEPDTCACAYFLKKDGTVLWKLKDKNYIEGFEILSISNNGEYISVGNYSTDAIPGNIGYWWEDRHFDGKLYDKNLNIILDGFGYISEDGSKFIKVENEKIFIIEVSNKTVLKEYNIKITDLRFSSDLRIIATIGEMENSPNNIFVIDTQTDEIWGTKINFEVTTIFLSKDGKFLLISGAESKWELDSKLWFYQIYY